MGQKLMSKKEIERERVSVRERENGERREKREGKIDIYSLILPHLENFV